MHSREYWKIGLALLAAAAVAVSNLDTLPRYPDKLPWSPETSWFAFACGSASILLWFYAITWLSAHTSNTPKLARALLLVAFALLGSVALIAPYLLALLVFAACRIAFECGEDAQGFFNVLTAFAWHLPMGLTLIASALLVTASAIIAGRPGGRSLHASNVVEVNGDA